MAVLSRVISKVYGRVRSDSGGGSYIKRGGAEPSYLVTAELFVVSRLVACC